MPSPHHGPHTKFHRRLALVLAAAAISACSEHAIPTSPAALSAPDAGSASSRRDERSPLAPATLTWQATARRQVAAHSTVSPIAAVRIYALVGVAQYGAAVAVDDAAGIRGGDDYDRDHRGAAFDEESEASRAQADARRGAIAAASLAVLKPLFPDSAAAMQAQFDAERAGATGPAQAEFARGMEIGSAMGLVMTTRAGDDGFGVKWLPPQFLPWLPGTEGRWYQTPVGSPPAGFQFPGMRPYFMESSAQFHPLPPPEFGSRRFLTGLKVVQQIAKHRSDKQIASANFWNMPAGTPTALGHWDEEAARFIDTYGLGERAASHVFALTNAAAMDATIGCWEAKYSIGLLRPFQADADLVTVFLTPNHPSYPSGHSCVSASAVAVLSDFFPDERHELERGVIEAGQSRVYAGIHYPFDIEAGQSLGRSAAAWAMSYDRTRGLLRAVGR